MYTAITLLNKIYLTKNIIVWRLQGTISPHIKIKFDNFIYWNCKIDWRAPNYLYWVTDIFIVVDLNSNYNGKRYNNCYLYWPMLHKLTQKSLRQTTSWVFIFIFVVFSLWFISKIIPLIKNWQLWINSDQRLNISQSSKLALIKPLKISSVISACIERIGRVVITCEININMIELRIFLLLFLPLTLQCDMSFDRL